MRVIKHIYELEVLSQQFTLILIISANKDMNIFHCIINRSLFATLLYFQVKKFF